jgi:toxin ParE1/3/4
MSRYRLSRAAEQDVEAILRDTRRTFGTGQRNRYAEIIRVGIEMIATEPDRPGSRQRSDVHPEIRSFHLDLAAGRIGATAHHLFYLKQEIADGEVGIVVLRILHERMDVRRHIFDLSN